MKFGSILCRDVNYRPDPIRTQSEPDPIRTQSEPDPTCPKNKWVGYGFNFFDPNRIGPGSDQPD
jgi:hypothetical protein